MPLYFINKLYLPIGIISLKLILNINAICGYTSLIENQLNDSFWINENACGDGCECEY